ncbi:MAG: four helix bundle protein, partial [Bradymonadaceae bacterium]
DADLVRRIDEKYGLVAQLRQAAVSVPSNIAEGSARDTDAQFLRFLNHARGSLAEIDTQLELAGELGILDGLDVSDARRTFDRVSSALQSLINRIEADRRG